MSTYIPYPQLINSKQIIYMIRDKQEALSGLFKYLIYLLAVVFKFNNKIVELVLHFFWKNFLMNF